MMPPHYNQVDPAPGGPLSGPTITIRGYSLRYAADPVVWDDTDGERVQIQLDLQVGQVGRGLHMTDPPPGSIQERSVLTIGLPPLPAGHAIRVEYLSETFRWTTAG
jgi:hypothetical protein